MELNHPLRRMEALQGVVFIIYFTGTNLPHRFFDVKHKMMGSVDKITQNILDIFICVTYNVR